MENRISGDQKPEETPASGMNGSEIPERVPIVPADDQKVFIGLTDQQCRVFERLVRSLQEAQNLFNEKRENLNCFISTCSTLVGYEGAIDGTWQLMQDEDSEKPIGIMKVS